MSIKRVWIEDGCIACNLCQDLAPEVFEVPPGQTSRTVKKYIKLLKKGGDASQERVREAAESCPVEVIQFEDDKRG